MSTSYEFAEYVKDQISMAGEVAFKKMFGEYMIYVNSLPILLLCDNTVYVKMIPEVKDVMQKASKGIPYPKAKEHYILDIDDQDLSLEAVRILVQNTVLKPKRPKKIIV